MRSAAKKQKKILILYTGGTFGMTETGEGGGLSSQTVSPARLVREFRERVPELARICKTDVEVVLNCDSAQIGPSEWVQLAERIRKRWKKYDGVVVLHGTDTLAYTATALSFLLSPCLRPVVITGAQRPLSSVRTDARRNLVSAVEIAATGPAKVVNQVSVFFDDRLFQGNRVHKRSAFDFAAFESPFQDPLAVVGTEIRYFPPATLVRSNAEKLKPSFSQKILVTHVTPGFVGEIWNAEFFSKLDAWILVVFTSGTGPTENPAFMKAIRQATMVRIPVILVTEEGFFPKASNEQSLVSVYEAGRKLEKSGCLWARRMTVECAYVKAALILGQNQGARNFAKLWSRSLAGEC